MNELMMRDQEGPAWEAAAHNASISGCGFILRSVIDDISVHPNYVAIERGRRQPGRIRSIPIDMTGPKDLWYMLVSDGAGTDPRMLYCGEG